MTKPTRTLWTALLFVGVTGTLALARGPLQDPVLRESDHKKLAKEVVSFWEATEEKKGIQDSFDDLSETVEKLQKKVKDRDLLAAIADWEEIFRIASLDGMKDPRSKGKVAAQTGEDTPAYTFVVPKSYSYKKGPYPMVLIVPDAGVDAEAHLEEAWADPAVRDGAILIAVNMDGADGDWGGEEGIYRVMSTFGAIARLYAFDYDRVFLAGSGQGFAAAAATANGFPQLFAGLIARGEAPEVGAINFRNLPTFLGDGGDALKARIDELGYENCTSADGAGAADVWAWIESNERAAYPTHLTYAPGIARAAHWIKVDGVNIEEDPYVDAVADRESNTITIDARKIAVVEVMFNDALVDMDQPVRVVVNGTAHEELVPRNKRLMINLVFQQGDWGRVFSNVKRFDVPAPSDG